MSIECVSSMSSRSMSSSVTSTKRPFSISKPRTMSSADTDSPVSLSTLSYPIGFSRPFSLWRKWNLSSCDEVAVYIFTGTDTSPNEIAPDQIDRAMPARFPLPRPINPVPGFGNRTACLEPHLQAGKQPRQTSPQAGGPRLGAGIIPGPESFPGAPERGKRLWILGKVVAPGVCRSENDSAPAAAPEELDEDAERSEPGP